MGWQSVVDGHQEFAPLTISTVSSAMYRTSSASDRWRSCRHRDSYRPHRRCLPKPRRRHRRCLHVPTAARASRTGATPPSPTTNATSSSPTSSQPGHRPHRLQAPKFASTVSSTPPVAASSYTPATRSSLRPPPPWAFPAIPAPPVFINGKLAGFYTGPRQASSGGPEAVLVRLAASEDIASGPLNLWRSR